MNYKIKKTKSNKQEVLLRNCIIRGRGKMGFPNKKSIPVNIDSNSWFDIIKKDFKIVDLEPIDPIDKSSKMIKCQKIVILFTVDQKRIILKWMDAAIDMYNLVIKEFNTYVFQKIPLEGDVIKFRSIRDTYLEQERKDISARTGTPCNILANAVKRACTALKSAQTNLFKGHINHFTLKYIKKNNPTKIISIEPSYISSLHNSFYRLLLGNNIDVEGFQLNTIKTTSTVHYNSDKKMFTLLVPIHFQSESIDGRETIAGDAGVRTFFTGTSKDHTLEICNGVSEKLNPIFKRIDKVNSADISKAKKRKKTTRLYDKAENIVTELHWKTINYLVSNYDSIIIGKWNTQSCMKGNLPDCVKRVMNQLSFYKFLTKLEYKCKATQTNLFITPEHYTSRLCSRCGANNTKLGSSKVFHCDKCRMTIDRDVNSSRNIYFKSQY